MSPRGFETKPSCLQFSRWIRRLHLSWTQKPCRYSVSDFSTIIMVEVDSRIGLVNALSACIILHWYWHAIQYSLFYKKYSYLLIFLWSTFAFDSKFQNRHAHLWYLFQTPSIIHRSNLACHSLMQDSSAQQLIFFALLLSENHRKQKQSVPIGKYGYNRIFFERTLLLFIITLHIDVLTLNITHKSWMVKTHCFKFFIRPLMSR